MRRTTKPGGKDDLVSVTVKMPEAMQAALEKLAEREFSSVSGILKKAAEKFLLDNGIIWREEGEK